MRWLNILKVTFQWIELPPYSGNTVKRVSGRPKGYITDTGIAASLQRVSSPQALSGHPQLSALFETHVVLDLCKRFSALSPPPRMYHWRLHSGNEVDVILERDGIFHSIEIKCAGTIKPGDAAGIKAFRSTFPRLNHGAGYIIAPVEKAYALTDDIFVIPYDCT